MSVGHYAVKESTFKTAISLQLAFEASLYHGLLEPGYESPDMNLLFDLEFRPEVMSSMPTWSLNHTKCPYRSSSHKTFDRMDTDKGSSFEFSMSLPPSFKAASYHFITIARILIFDTNSI